MFDHLENQISIYNQHLIETETIGSQIEQVFVGYLLIRIHAEFEKSIKSAIADRCHIEQDSHLNAFNHWTIDRIIRSIRISELSNILSHFDEEYKELFTAISDRIKNSWSNILSDRHSFAHKVPTHATLSEIQKWFSEAQGVIVAFRKALGLPD